MAPTFTASLSRRSLNYRALQYIEDCFEFESLTLLSIFSTSTSGYIILAMASVAGADITDAESR